MLALSPFFLASSLVSSALAATFNVDVGAGGLVFNPNKITAQAGDEVLFTFRAKNHTVTQSSLANPCDPLAGGGDSGFVPVAPGTTDFPTKRIIVPSTVPLWFHCKQGNHCKSGMVFAINPSSDAQMQEFIANAMGQDTGTPTAPPPATGSPRVHEVMVGQGGLVFTPEKLEGAQVGDSVRFTYMSGAHTVTQSTFASPCSPLSNGIDSGPKPFTAGQTPPTFEMNITTTDPTWYYCKTGAHCQSGMVFSINPTADKTHEAFKATAMGNAPPSGTTQTGSTTTGPSAPTGTPKVFEITVGQGGTVYSPEKITGAAVGDQVRFVFAAGSHTVTQSTFVDPCNPAPNGADSGPQPVQAGATGDARPMYMFNVTSIDKPLWFYCKTGDHCRRGMVFSINETPAQTHEAFKATAMGAAPPNNGTGPDQNGTPDAAPARLAGGAVASLVFAAAAAGLLL